MSKLHEIASALKTELEDHYQTVRVSAIQTQEQFTRELKAINPDKLPGVIIVFDNMTLGSERIQECHFTLVVVDKFSAASDAKALSVFQAAANLLDYFPVTGRVLATGVYVCPTDCIAASPDAQFAALALGLLCKQVL